MSENKTTKKKQASLEEQLESGEKQKVLKALDEIKKVGRKETVPLLFQLLGSTGDEDIYANTLTMLQTLKVKDAEGLYIEALENPALEKEQEVILSAFWQSAQDATEYLGFFVDLAIRTKDYMVCFECFSILEHTDSEFTEEELLQNIQKLQMELEMNHQHSTILQQMKDMLAEKIIG